MTTLTFLGLAAGVAILTVGAELLVRGASRLAAVAGISPLIIGLTVVAYGTSAPEAAVSLKSAFAGQSDIALGNVVGSNVFNVLFILGVCALILPLRVDSQLVRLDVPIMIGASVLVFLMGLDGQIGRVDASLLLAGVVAYTVLLLRKSRREHTAVQEEFSREYPPVRMHGPGMLAWNGLLLAVGLALLVGGARLFVDNAVTVAEALGVSQLIIGLTIVAAGTSLPEVATSIVAAFRGERDIAIGNVVGSNIFNLLFVLGSTALALPVPLGAEAMRVSIPVMIGAALICLPIFFTDYLIKRWEGALFVLLYVTYTLYLILSASGTFG